MGPDRRGRLDQALRSTKGYSTIREINSPGQWNRWNAWMRVICPKMGLDSKLRDGKYMGLSAGGAIDFG